MGGLPSGCRGWAVEFPQRGSVAASATPTEVDPPVHDAPRRVLATVLSVSVLRGHRELWGSIA